VTVHFPLEYAVDLITHHNAPMEISSAHRPHLVVGPPPELGGSDAWWSPEHLLVSALATCMTATFAAAAARAHVPLGAYRCRAKGVLDRFEGKVAFTEMLLAVDVTVVADDVERTRRLLEEAKARCFVANTLRCPVTLLADVTGS
jgi:organic hydroperoxide reductase OsmC/OhrA